jgi:RNA polymerase sigma factor (TIGR02999 family)
VSDVTSILSAIEQGVPKATDDLLPLVYDELRRLATAQMAQEKPGQTLQATALVHETYLKLFGKAGAAEANPRDDDNGRWNSRGHFFAAAAEAMRRILVDQARKKQTEKRGGSRQRLVLTEAVAPEALPPLELLALNEAIEQLSQMHPQHAALVKLRYFAGLTLEDAASNLGISLSTAKRHWTWARAWLFEQLAG